MRRNWKYQTWFRKSISYHISSKKDSWVFSAFNKTHFLYIQPRLVCNVKISIYFQLQLCTMIQSTCLATYMSISVHHCVWCSYSYIICCIFTKYQICVMWLSAQKYIISNSKVKCRWPPDNLPDHTPTKLRIFCSAFDDQTWNKPLTQLGLGKGIFWS